MILFLLLGLQQISMLNEC